MQVPGQEEFTQEQIRQQLDRLLGSQTLRRSRRLQQFLRYVTELTLAGDAAKINEYLLGIEVFDRGPDYNAAEDSVVRRQAHALRNKIAQYYRSEGASDPIRIEIPLGQYVPLFCPNQTEAEQISPPSPSGLQAVIQSKGYWAFAVVLVCTGLTGLSFWAGRATAPEAPRGLLGAAVQQQSGPIDLLWSRWLSGDSGPLVCFSSPLTATIKDFSAPLPSGSMPPRLEIPTAIAEPFRKVLNLSDDGYHYIYPTRTETKNGEVVAAVELANLFAMRGLPVSTAKSTTLTWEDFRSRNIIVFGHNEQSEWIDPLLEGYPLTLVDTSGERQRRIVNHDPRDGEAEFYQVEYVTEPGLPQTEYALVSLLPGLDGVHELLVVSGLNSQGTLMAVEFMVDEQRAAQLVDELRSRAPQLQGSWYFQLVLKAEVRENVPTGGSIEMIRFIDPTARPVARVDTAKVK